MACSEINSGAFLALHYMYNISVSGLVHIIYKIYIYIYTVSKNLGGGGGGGANAPPSPPPPPKCNPDNTIILGVMNHDPFLPCAR